MRDEVRYGNGTADAMVLAYLSRGLIRLLS